MFKFRSNKVRLLTQNALSIMLALVAVQTIASDVYDAATNKLYIPSVQVGNTTYTDVVITVGELISAGGSSETASNAYNIKSIYEDLVKGSETNQFNLKGSVNGLNVTGSGVATNGNLVASSFQGSPALAKTSNITMTLRIDGQTIPSAASGQSYYDSNYNLLGQSGPEFEVVTSRNAYPTAAKVNDAGLLYESTVYTSSAKVSIIGTETTSYSITYDTENSIIFTLVSIRKNLAGFVIQTGTANLRVTKDNVITRIFETSNDSTTFLTISY